ncbi:MAG: DUF1653 domain-containing protein [Nanoarchaeota archaeon]
MERPKVGVGIIILRDDKVLMQKRKNSHGDGTWCFPGGHLELNESPEECAKRETYEELGIDINNVYFATITNDIFTSERKHYITIYMVADSFSGEPKIMEPDKSEQFGWFNWNNLPQPLFIPIQNLLKQRYDPTKKKYQHYKGNYYQFIGEGKHSETLEDFIVYKALYESEPGKNVLWIRPKSMFFENVIFNGKEVPRFKFVGAKHAIK